MEGSFAQATRFGLKRARWRGQWRVQIQDYLIAIVQNVELLIAHAWPKPRIVLALVDFKKIKCGIDYVYAVWCSQHFLVVTSHDPLTRTELANWDYFLAKSLLGNNPY